MTQESARVSTECTESASQLTQETETLPTDLVQQNMENLTENNQESRFRNLKFRDKLKVRGRPKRPVKQLCSFNKSVADRVTTRNLYFNLMTF